MSSPYLEEIKVFYENGARKVKCFCGETCNKAITYHLRNKHPEVWQEWCMDFVKQFNLGRTPHGIMNHYRLSDGRYLFSWTVVERAIHEMIEDNRISFNFPEKTRIEEWGPRDFKLERTSVWDFKERGNWAVHQNDYRGNWSPRLVRNLILKYTRPRDWILDPFVGGGTTLIEAWLNRRKSVGVDISRFAIEMTNQRLAEMRNKSPKTGRQRLLDEFQPLVERGDSRELLSILDRIGLREEMFALVCVHPPYFDAFAYTQTLENDLSRIHSLEKFSLELQKIASQIYRCLRDNGVCAVLIGDVRKKNRIVPLGFKVMSIFANEGFELKEIIIKVQRRDRSTSFWYKSKSIDFLIAHEYLLIFDKSVKLHANPNST